MQSCWLRLSVIPLVFWCLAGSEPVDLQNQVQQVLDQYEVPAVGLLISTPEGVQIAVAGKRSAVNETEVEPDDAWHIGSCTKAITALLAGRLVDQGVISWETTPADVLVDLPEPAKALAAKVTLRQLLSHTSGLPGRELDGIVLPISQLQLSLGNESTVLRRNVSNAILSVKPAASPGEAWAYCNGGYIVASSMLEAAAKRPFEELMQDQVLQPLGVTTAGWGLPPELKGHIRRSDRWEPLDLDNPKPYDAAGRMHLTLSDWNLLCRILLEDDRDFLTDATRATLTDPAIAEPPYALGWIVQDDPTLGPIYTHAGSNTMWFAHVIVIPREKAVVLAVCNAPDAAAVQSLTRIGVGMLQRDVTPTTRPAQ